MRMNGEEIVFIRALQMRDNELSLFFVDKGKASSPDDNITEYRFVMLHHDSGEEAGRINLRAGYTENIEQYRGNIGYVVYEKYRGHHYAARSCKLLVPVLHCLEMESIFITCNVGNIPSMKSIELLGAEFLGESSILGDSPYYSYYPEGSRRKRRYEWKPG